MAGEPRRRTRRRAAIDFSELAHEAENGNDDSGDDFVDQSVSSPEPELPAEPESPPPKRMKVARPKKEVKKEAVKVEPDIFSEAVDSKRQESLRDRMQLFYGADQDLLVAAVWLRIKWGSMAFIPSQEIIEKEEEPTKPLPDQTIQVQSPYKVISDSPALPQSVVEVDGTRLEPGQTRQCPGIFVMNLGAAISVIHWAPNHDGLLAVGLLDDTTEPPIDASASRPSLSLCSRSGCLSRIAFLSLESNALKVVKTVFTEHGPVLDMAWQPSDDPALACVFQDGSCGLIKVPTEANVQIEPQLLLTDYTCTCVCWRDPTTLVVGMSDGSIGEFDLSGEFSGEPSWIVPVHHSAITAIASAGPEHPSFVCTSSIDGFVQVVNLNDPRRWKYSTPRISHPVSVTAWSRMAQSFIGLEDQTTTRLVPLRRPSLQLSSTSLTRHAGAVSAVATSDRHPMIMTGGEDGTLHITNVIRRTMVTRRNKGIHSDGKLWTLECSERTSQFRFVEELSSQEILKTKAGSERNAHLNLFPKACTITSISWAPSRNRASWYAAGTAAGLLRVENLNT